MRIFNIDGREVLACGNATRCVAHLLLEESGLSEMVLETGGGMLECRRVGPMQISVDMGPMSTDWRDFPVASVIDMLHVPVDQRPAPRRAGGVDRQPACGLFRRQPGCG